MHYLDTVKLHVSECYCDINSGSDGPVATSQGIPLEPNLDL